VAGGGRAPASEVGRAGLSQGVRDAAGDNVDTFSGIATEIAFGRSESAGINAPRGKRISAHGPTAIPRSAGTERAEWPRPEETRNPAHPRFCAPRTLRAGGERAPGGNCGEGVLSAPRATRRRCANFRGRMRDSDENQDKKHSREARSAATALPLVVSRCLVRGAPPKLAALDASYAIKRRSGWVSPVSDRKFDRVGPSDRRSAQGQGLGSTGINISRERYEWAPSRGVGT